MNEEKQISNKQRRWLNRTFRRNRNVPFIQRIMSKDLREIPDWENPYTHTATHKLSWFNSENGYDVIPDIEDVNGNVKITLPTSYRKMKK